MSPPTLEWTLVGKNISNTKISNLDSTPVSAKIPYPKPLTLPTEYSKHKEKRKNGTYRRIWSQTHHYQTHHRANIIHPMTANT